MRFFVKAVASGFAFSMGSAIFKKVSKKLGLDEAEIKTEEAESASEAASEEPESR